MLKETLIFAGGAVIGAAVSYFITKKYYEKRNEEELDATREFYESQDDFSHVVIATPKEDEPKENEREEEEAYKEKVSKYNSHYSIGKPDLATIVEQVRPEQSINILNPNNEDPEELLFNQETLEYYEGDGILSDLHGQPVDISSVIGSEALDHFGEFGEEDIVRVRNRKLGTDYEVVRVHARYVDLN